MIIAYKNVACLCISIKTIMVNEGLNDTAFIIKWMARANIKIGNHNIKNLKANVFPMMPLTASI